MSAVRDTVWQAVLSTSSFRPKKRGNVIDICCPRHEDRTPSAWVGDHAWGCLTCDFKEPLSTLAQHMGIDVPRTGGYTVHDYAREKHFEESKLRAYGVFDDQVNGRDVVAIEYRSAAGKVLRRKFRAGKKKWWEGTNQQIHLYGLDRLVDLKAGDTVVLVEGESDCHAAWHHGFNAVGLPGATTWREEWAEPLKELDLVLWQEPDQGGAQFTAKIASSFPDARVIDAPPVKDLADLHRTQPKEFDDVLRTLIAGAQRIGTRKPPVVFDALIGMTLAQLRVEKLMPIDAVPTPFPTWNRHCCDAGGRRGIARGWHVVAAAKSGTGKSILALNMGAAAVRAGEQVCFVSLEMSQAELATRLLAIISSQRVVELEQGDRFSTAAFDTATRSMQELHEQTGGLFWCNREPIHHINDVVDSILYHHEVRGCRYFIVDYMQLAANVAEIKTIEAVSSAVRKCAKDLRVVTIGLSQFNRSTSASKERPTKEGLMGGSPLENDADQVILIDHSVTRALPAPRTGYSSNLIIDKNRHGGAEDIGFEFDRDTLRMREMLPDELPARPSK